MTIQKDATDDYLETPSFEKAIYYGNVSSTGGFSMENISLGETVADEDVTVRLSGTGSEYFSWSRDANVITLSYANGMTQEELNKKSVVTFTLEVERPSTSSASLQVGRTAVVVSFLGTDSKQPRFEKSFYSGTIDEALIVDSIVLEADTYEEIVTFNITAGGEFAQRQLLSLV